MVNVFIFTTSIEHTTHRKAARLLQSNGANVLYSGFCRNNFPEGKLEGIKVVRLGNVSHGNYFKRLITGIKTIKKIRALGKDSDIVYCFTLDGLIISYLSFLFSKKKFVFQVQDIRPIFFGTSLISKLAKVLEKYTLRHVSLLVVSSPNYYNDYFKPEYAFPEERVLVIENKLVSEVAYEERVTDSFDPIVIGYFGVLRCSRSWECLFNTVSKNQVGLRLYLRGKIDAIPEMEKLIVPFKNISYGGMYRSPEDLADVYSKVDLVWACYPFSNKNEGNWKMARTIRFYEAIAFKKPVIVQKGTAQEEEVLSLNIGVVVDMNNPSDVKRTLENITFDDIQEWKSNIEALPKSYAFHDNEHRDLVNRIEILKGNV